MTSSFRLLSNSRATQASFHKSSRASTVSADSTSTFDDALAAARQSAQPPAAAPTKRSAKGADNSKSSVDSKDSKDAKETSQDTSAAHAIDSPANDAADSAAAHPATPKLPSDETSPPEKAKAQTNAAATDPAAAPAVEIALQVAATLPVPQTLVAQTKPAATLTPPAANAKAIGAPPAAAKAAPAAPKPTPDASGNTAPETPDQDSAAPKSPKAPAPHAAQKAPPPIAPAPAAAIEAKASLKVADSSVPPSPEAAPAPHLSPSSTSAKQHAALKLDPSQQSANSSADTVPQSSATSPDSNTTSLAQSIEGSTTPIRTDSAPIAEKPDAGTSGLAGIASPVTTKTSSTADRASSAPPAQDSHGSDSSSTFDQIVLGLRGKLDARNGKAEIRLDPPNLGTVRVSVNLDKGNLTAQFHSSSDVVRDLLKSNMEKLKTVLESQGITVDKLAVDSSAAKQPVAVNAPSAQNAANDGRSAGQYQQNASDQKRSQKESSTFARVWRDATEDAAPIDLVA